ncbi:MAG TPA: aromatic ring-hydroxylating dioxygenase subunit alpha [Stellaceae bacterium]|nr:aromatic ring-hydroxylating dioxygenase subunit alpha [Stellaceae bacterium]
MRTADFIDLDAGTLSREIFSSEDIFRRELERVFLPAWNFVGHTSQLAQAGDFFLSRVGTEPVIVSRDQQGAIHVLLNSCRHRGMPACRYDVGNAKGFTCSYHGWSYGLDGALTGVPKFDDRYRGRLDREKWGLIRARVSIFYGSIWATFDDGAPSFEDYLGADMRFYLRSLLQGPDGGDDGYEVIGGIVKWQIPCNWKFGAENFAGDHYHGYSHISVERLSIGLSGRTSRHNFAAVKIARQAMSVADPKRGHTIRASVYQALGPYDPQAGAPDEVNAYYRKCHEERQRRLGDKARLMIHGGVIFPNTHFNSAGRTTIGLWLPLAAGRTEVWRWLFVPRNAPNAVKETLREYYLRYAGPSGMVEQDDMENWTAAQRGTEGMVARKHPFNYQLAMGLARRSRPDEWLGDEVSITEDVAEHNQRAFYAHWARLMATAP